MTWKIALTQIFSLSFQDDGDYGKYGDDDYSEDDSNGSDLDEASDDLEGAESDLEENDLENAGKVDDEDDEVITSEEGMARLRSLCFCKE